MEEKSEQPEVVVLMSAYNGEKYIEEQIESIFSQEGVCVKLIVRDDGSTDRTIKILEDYEALGKLQIIQGNNKGFIESFWEMVLKAPESDYYAFADQDDVWLKNKLLRAVEHLRKEPDIPTLYCANYYSVDEKLQKSVQEDIFSMDGWEPEYFILTQTPALGNTMVWNCSLMKKLRLHPECNWISEHDHRLQFAAAMLGKIIIDEERTILYRQHENNTSGGIKRGALLKWWRVKKKMLMARMFGDAEHRHSCEVRAQNFLKYYRSDLDKKMIENLEMVANYRNSFADTMKFLQSHMFKVMPIKIKLRVFLHCL